MSSVEDAVVTDGGEPEEAVASGEAAAGSDGVQQPEEESDEGKAADKSDKSDKPDDEMLKIEKEKEGMTATEKLEHAFCYKIEGNEFFKKDDIFRAADCYYRAVVWCRDLTQNPKYYPKCGHTEAQRSTAQGLVESVFCNLALVQSKYGASLPKGAERDKVLKEAVKSASEALKLNSGNVKALYRRGLCKGHLARELADVALAGGTGNQLREAQELCAEAKADLLAATKADEQNRDARKEHKAIQELAKRLKQEELKRDKKEFSFKGSLSALQEKAQDLVGDGSVQKQQVVTSGDGAQWFNEDWLLPDSRHRCVVQIRCRLLEGAGKADVWTATFALGDADMHEGIRIATRNLSKGEVACFAIAPARLASQAHLAQRLPAPPAAESVWELELVSFAVYDDLDSNGSRLLKIHEEGYGHFPEDLAECDLHWKVIGSDGKTLHSSRFTMSVGGGRGLEQVEDPERAPYHYILGETTWPPVATLCRALRQGGRGELRLKHAPSLPEKDPGAPADAVSAQIGSMLSKRSGALQDCAVHVELERVMQPLRGPNDPNWSGGASLVAERFLAERLLEQGEDDAALRRYRRACTWAEEAQQSPDGAEMLSELMAARAGLAWVLAKRAAPILDLGTVSSDVLRAANSDLDEADAHCKWLEEHQPGHPSARLVRAKVLVARDDDFEGAHAQLVEAQRLVPDDARIQAELKAVRAALQKEREAQTRQRVASLRDSLAAAREQGSEGEAKAATLLAELAATKVSWEVITETRVGVELKRTQDASSDPATKKLCSEILGRWMDESKEQRPMWER